MIPKAEVLAVTEESGLLPTTVEKDYALGWVLFAISQHPVLGRWHFKGGTCLKKCYFDTYRFSEDLDFTIPAGTPYDGQSVRDGLFAIAEWVRDRSGLDFPADGTNVTESINKRGHKTYDARMTFVGPLNLPRAQRQRIRFDLTQDEVLLDPAEEREVFHGYSDVPDPVPRVQCYTLAEILAEKIRALVERSGRARDVYDVVNVGRNLRAELPRDRIAIFAAKKFAFKSLDPPVPGRIFERLDQDILATDWTQALRHQLPVLPPVAEFVSALRDILSWLLGAAPTPPPLPAVSVRDDETPVPPIRFGHSGPLRALGRGTLPPLGVWPEAVYGTRMDRVRYAARNRLLARITYHGVARVVEPYSLRRPNTGNLLLYVFEVERGFGPGGEIKAFKVSELGEVRVTDRSFHPRYAVEL